MLKSETHSKRGKKGPHHPLCLGCRNDLVWHKMQTRVGRWEGPWRLEPLCALVQATQRQSPWQNALDRHLVCVPLPCVVMMQGRFSDDHGEDEGPVWVLGQSVQLSAYIPVKPWEPGSQRCMDLCNGLASASLWVCGFPEGRNQGCLAYQQIPGPCMVPGVPTGSINICGMIKGCCWMAEGSRVMKTRCSVLFLNAIELKCSQNEGVGPGDLSSNSGGVYVDDVTSTSHLLVCTLR